MSENEYKPVDPNSEYMNRISSTGETNAQRLERWKQQDKTSYFSSKESTVPSGQKPPVSQDTQGFMNSLPYEEGKTVVQRSKMVDFDNRQLRKETPFRKIEYPFHEDKKTIVEKTGESKKDLITQLNDLIDEKDDERLL